MRNTRFYCWLAVCLGVLGLTSSAQALSVAIMPLWHRVALADCVVIGKVSAIEDKLVMASVAPNGPMEEHRVAVLKLDKGFGTAKGLTHVRIGATIPKPPQPGVPQIAGIEMTYPVNLAVGQEFCLILQPHHKETFFVAPRSYEAIRKQNNANFDKEAALIERCFKLLENPDASLKSKDAEDRLLTAGMLLTRYKMTGRGVRAGEPAQKTEPIDATQNKLILEALASADWTKRDPAAFISPAQVFGYLQLTDKDGWKQPQNFNEMPAAAQKWLKDHAATHRIQRFVPEKPNKQ
ncbi:MAG: hypothetical protein JNM56_25835 [Planctomycetia bacterium]|nr:hypothetical protein [Planctomycetia bacterium]